MSDISDRLKDSLLVVGGIGTAVASSYYIDSHTMPMDCFGYAGLVAAAGMTFQGFRRWTNNYFTSRFAKGLTTSLFLTTAVAATGISAIS